jgi:hypothetical protein
MNALKNRTVLFCILSWLFMQCREASQFEEMPSSETGVVFRNDITETKHNNIMTYEYSYNGGGVAVGDLNHDGLTDVYFSGNAVPNKLFLNKGDWKFEDVTAAAGVAGRSDWKTGVTLADVNGDGWLDIYVCYSGNAPGEGYRKPVIRDQPKRANQLFINQGCKPGGIPTFTEQAAQLGLDAKGTFSTQAYFLDYDLDGDLDMFLLNHANMFYRSTFNVTKLRTLRHPYFGNKLYRNDSGKFMEVSEQAGIHGSGVNFGLSAAISDLNADQWPDIYVTNDYDEQDFCYINNRDGTFTEVSHKVFGNLSKFGMGSDIADINNDGLLDIFVADMLPEDNYRQKLLRGGDEYDKYTLFVDSGYHHQYMRNTLQLNRGFAPDSLPRFSEVAQLAGISNTDWSWAPLFADFDNDGLKDLFITNGYLKDFTNLDFQKYTVHEMVQKANDHNHPVDELAMIQKIPSTKLNRYFFKNTDGLHFANVSANWGLERKTISNAAAYADLDNDGDLDLVVSCLNDEVSVLQNHHDHGQKNNYIKLKLSGAAPNTQALGAKVVVTAGDQEQMHEVYFTRGYQSSVEPVLTFGIGTSTTIPKIEITWPDSRVTTLNNVTPNQLLTVNQETVGQPQRQRPVIRPSLLIDKTNESGIDFEHVENPFVDFKFQRLVPYQLSRLGSKLSVGDVDHDGNDDVFFGGAHRGTRKLFLGRDDGSFITSPQPLPIDQNYEDAGAVFFDADSDGNLDLYVVSGGNEFPLRDTLYQDRLYKGDGKGGFKKIADALPKETTSGSCVVTADFDKDGDLDLFVGGRLVVANYPTAPRSMILRNDSKGGHIQFTDVTKQMASDLVSPGMVTDALWTDVNNDTWPDLIMVGEWMPVRIFQNEQGHSFKETTASLGLEGTHGWWNKIFAADVDHDGDTDFLAGNAGLNLQLTTSPQEPVRLYAQDINNDGEIDPLICHYIQGKSYPLATRDELLEQVTPLRKKFTQYASYANAGIEDVLGENLLSRAQVYTANTFQSSWLENDGHGKFNVKPLPALAQFSAIQAFVQADFDADGSPEVLATGNFYPYRVRLGRSNASMGVMLKFKAGEVTVYRPDSPLWLTGDIRDAGVVKFKHASNKIIISRNNDKASVFEMGTRSDAPLAKRNEEK